MSAAVAHNVRAALARRDLTVADLARSTGLAFPSLLRKSKGLSDLTVTELMLIAQSLGIEPETLLSPEPVAQHSAEPVAPR